MGGFDWARERPPGALCAVRRTRTATTPRPLTIVRHPARRACHTEMASRKAIMQLHAVAAGKRTFYARQCRIWACQPKGALVMEACTICSSAMTWGVKIGAGHMSIASHTPHPGKLTCRSSRK